jgi:uncharacterized heparinase superfamily protein
MGEALLAAVRRQLRAEWAGNPLHLWSLERPAADGFAAIPLDPRPISPRRGKQLLEGTFALAGESISVGREGDPWDRPSPSRRFAVELHRFAWVPDLVALGEGGAREALRLTFQWEQLFGRWNGFSWSGEVLDRRVFNLACGSGAMAVATTEEEALALSATLARQARQLLRTKAPEDRRCQRLAAAAIAGAALSGKASAAILKRALPRLDRALIADVLPDGGHVTRSPEAVMELLFDLRSLDEVLHQRGFAQPAELGRAIDRLTSALRFLTLPDGMLACFQGGEASAPRMIAAARSHDERKAPPPPHLPRSGYQRLTGKALSVIVDAGPPAVGAMSEAAVAQPLGIEIVAGGERLVSNAAWSPRAPGAQALRLTDAGSTVSLGVSSAGRPLTGFRARQLGARLVGGAQHVEVSRRQADAGDLLELSHDGWVREFGVLHRRRLYLDTATDEIRGEDAFEPSGPPKGSLVAYAIHFHLYPGATATVARDSHSVLLRTPTQGGWWLRNDAPEVRVEPAVHFQNGRPTPTAQVVLRGHFRAEKGGRIRWKLAAAEG